jgi:hypothetical protein
MVWRDEASDTGRLGSSDSPVRGTALCVEQDFSPTSIAEQNADGGWNKTDQPVGGPAPDLGYTIGSRGTNA